MFYRPFVLFRLFQRQILFQREAGGADGEGVVPAHIPPVPRLKHHAGSGLTLLRPAQDEAVLCGIGFQPLIGTGVGETGVLLHAVCREDVGTVAGGIFAGLRRRLDGRSPGSGLFLRAAGLPVAKHGNRSISSKSGAGDVLEALGVNIMAEPAKVEACVEKAGIGFMFAQLFNKSMKYVGQARKEMGVRTVFNILGPLANPSRAKNMVVGVYDASLTEKIALAMSRLGVERAFVVSGKDNMDEITTTTETVISEIKDGKVNTFTITPEQFGLKRASLEELRGGDGTENAVITKKILSGEEKGAKRDIVLLNAGATLYVGEAASTIEDGIILAKEAIDSGKAAGKLAELVKVSNEA